MALNPQYPCGAENIRSRRDGTPFANLLICFPFYDNKAIVQHFIGAQADMTGLVEDRRGVESFRQLLQKDRQPLTENKHMSEHSSQNKDT